MDVITSAVCLLLFYVITREALRLLRLGNYGNRYVFITGCDTGFGNLLAKRLDGYGLHVFAGCLTESGADELRKSSSKRLTTVHVDVTDENSIKVAKDFVAKKLPKGKGLWAVVNNAGIAGSVAPIEWQSADDFRQTININLYGVIFVTKAFLPLVRRERGRIVNMASSMGRFCMATGPYGAAKYGVEGFSDQLRREVYRSGVGVSIIEPGYFRTGITSADRIAQDLNSKFSQADPEVRQFYGEHYKNELVRRTGRLLDLFMSPQIHKVVDAYEHAVLARYPKSRYVVGWDAQILFRLLWNVPEWLADFLVTLPMPTPDGAKRR